MVVSDRVGDLTGKRFAIYLRRSEGEKGSTKNQLSRIEKDIKELEKRTGLKIDKRIVGKDINKKQRFDARRDLVKQGDIYNEGEGASGFKIANRPVFQELVRRMQDGQYDAIAVESFDRISRDIHGLSYFGLPLWREDGFIILGFDGKYLDDDLENEFLLGVTSNAASLTKAQEIKKSKIGVQDAISLGFLKTGRPEFIGSGTKNAGLDYREAYKVMKAQGESVRGTLNNPGTVGAMFGKDNKWASSWYNKMKDYEELGVLEDWLTNYERFNAFIVNLGGYPANKWKTDPQVANIKKHTSGYFGHPAGIKIESTKEFVTFPNPINLDLSILGNLKDPREYPNNLFKVSRKKTIPKNLKPVQIQGRARVRRT